MNEQEFELCTFSPEAGNIYIICDMDFSQQKIHLLQWKLNLFLL